jgi:hypothetical protein
MKTRGEGSRIVKQDLKPRYSYRATENKGNRENTNRKKKKRENENKEIKRTKKNLMYINTLSLPLQSSHRPGTPVVVGG